MIICLPDSSGTSEAQDMSILEQKAADLPGPGEIEQPIVRQPPAAVGPREIGEAARLLLILLLLREGLLHFPDDPLPNRLEQGHLQARVDLGQRRSVLVVFAVGSGVSDALWRRGLGTGLASFLRGGTTSGMTRKYKNEDRIGLGRKEP
jgi:hypothetical protein